MFTHRCRAAHELCEVPRNFGCIEYLFDGPTFPELRVGVVYRMSMVLTGCTAVNKTDGICGIGNLPIFARCSTPPPYLIKYSCAPLSKRRGAFGP